MSGIKDQHNLDELRDRLYARGGAKSAAQRHDLSPKQATDVPKNWTGSDVKPQPKVSEKPQPKSVESAPRTQISSPVPLQPTSSAPLTSATTTTPVVSPAGPGPTEESMGKKRRSYRKYILIGTFLFLFVSMVFSAAYLFFGGNQISPHNVAISMSGPFTIGGGEVLPVQIGITNENNAPIRSATLIVSYPPGTKTTDDNPRDLFEERLPLDDINPGETLNVPVRAVVFGEENQERTLNATVEYRLEGSSGTFFKDAEPLVFKISSSPLVLRVNAITQISSGQETDITLTLQSNSPTPLKDLLVVAEYPRGFDFTTAIPEPALGQNTWQIESIEPNSTHEIVITGVVFGQEDDEFEINFRVGTPNDANQLSLGAVLTTAKTDILIERPFIDTSLSINGDDDGVAVLSPGQRPSIQINMTNTLEDPVYDVRVVAALSGNAFAENEIRVTEGFYDSAANEVIWAPDTARTLSEVLPGEQRRFTFEMLPGSTDNTPEVEIVADVFAKRISSNQANEELIGTIRGVMRIATEVNLASELVRSAGDAGPIPPVAEELTEYTVNLVAENGTNDVTGGVVTFQLPPYVKWQDDFSGDGDVIFNPVSREVTWDVGNISANSTAKLTVVIGFVPSTTQVGDKPILISAQRFRGEDRFTGTVVRNEAAPHTSELSTELGFPRGNGTVVGQSDDD